MPETKFEIERGEVLLPIARAAIARELNVPHSADESAPWLVEHGACFVTLTQSSVLRGCIGSLQAHRPLLADVKSNAVFAAMRDPRFTPLRTEELRFTEIEISLLSPSQEMQVSDEADALAQMRPGVDGIIFLNTADIAALSCRRSGETSRDRAIFLRCSNARPACPMISGRKV